MNPLKDFDAEPGFWVSVLALAISWVPPGNCDHVQKVMPTPHHQYPYQLIEPSLCRAQPRPNEKR